MKYINRHSILTSLVATVFILSLFSGFAVAQNPGEKNENEYLKHKEKYENTGKLFEDAREQFEKALREFNAKKDSKSKEELILKTKEYLDRAIDHMVSYLEVLRSRAENSESKGIPFDVSKNIDAHVAQLEQLRTKVQKANSIEELRADNKELKEDLFVKIRLETRYDFEILLNNRIGNFITKADNISTRLDAAIQNLKSKDKDTSDLEKTAANYKNLVKEAKDDQQKTDALLATHSGFGADGTVTSIKEAEAFLKQVDNSQRETVKKLKEASRQLLDFVRDYRKLSGGKAISEGERERAVVKGTGTLVANGSGRAVIEGNITATLSGINGTLKVSSNANVIAVGGTNETLGNGEVNYHGFSSATITGNNIRVEISGNNIDLTATCTAPTTTCKAILNGNVKYSIVSGVSGNWSINSARKEV